MTGNARSRAASAARRSVTIRDVAERAGVSTATVSRALANPGQVAEATRSAVFRAISEVGFTPNAAARSLRARSTKMVLALLHGLGDSFYTAILNAVENTLFESGYGMIMGDTRADPARDRHYDRLVRSGQVDGVLLFSGRLPQDGFDDLHPTIPILLLCNAIPSLTTLPVIEVANRSAARTMTEHLIGLGHRRIAHITGALSNVESQERLLGFREGVGAANLPADDVVVWEGAFSFDAGAAAAKKFLALVDRPSAVFCASDQLAIGFIKAVRDAGLSVPEDVSVAGFDDIEYASLFAPALTTMHQPRAELGRRAAEYLVQRMNGKGEDLPKRTRLPCKLIVRDSVRAYRGASRERQAARQTEQPSRRTTTLS
jgi:LacI family repressor for deo operon, udp, cdd, tsx, nupC, and nupG